MQLNLYLWSRASTDIASIFCIENARISSAGSGSSVTFQIPVVIRSFLPVLIAFAICLMIATLRAALELAPSLFRPPIIADAIPSKATCSAVLPISSSMGIRFAGPQLLCPPLQILEDRARLLQVLLPLPFEVWAMKELEQAHRGSGPRCLEYLG
ncbi:hypothetical protein Cgig2_018094 [Carnegiea gigantea]|uniref:Uncharacterized protein n=1 Tax=Carnegiea gigantea TaxID=171969 RepID=A0A9Q1JY34_9CARY|nr:hypothetical protein Cgig2_018094 [Carnegiea gigantea]